MKQTTLALATTLALTAVSGTALAASKELNVYNWSDYIAESTLPNFQKSTGIKVRYDVYDSNEILQAKMLTGKSGYDLVHPSKPSSPNRSRPTCTSRSTRPRSLTTKTWIRN